MMPVPRRHYFDLDYFIEYFSDIPPKQWCKTTDVAAMDVWSWCDPDECKALYDLTNRWGPIDDINDGKPGYEIFGEGIKTRVVNFLEYIKDQTEDE
jgi:hypothetical protein